MSILSPLMRLGRKPSVIMDDPWQGGITGNQPIPGRPNPLSMDGMGDMPDNPLANLGAPTGEETPNNPLATLDKNYPTPILDRLSKLLTEEAPNPDDYKPSRTRRILGALAMGAGAGPAAYEGGAAVGFKANPDVSQRAYDNVVDAPYNKAAKRFDERAKYLTAGANVEEKKVTNLRSADQNQAANDIRQQQIDINKEKSDRIYEIKLKEAQDREDKANKAAEEWKQKFEADQTNRANLDKFHEAQLAAINARHAADLAQRDLERKRLEAQHADQVKQFEQREGRLKAATEGKSGPSETETTTTVTDAAGKPVGERKVVAKKGLPVTPKVGDKKQFPNGATGVWDGRGWVAQ